MSVNSPNRDSNRQTATLSKRPVVGPPLAQPRKQAARIPRWQIGLGLVGLSAISAIVGAGMAMYLASSPLKQALLTPEEAATFNQDEAVSYNNLSLPRLTRPVNVLVLGTKVLTSDVDLPGDVDFGYHALVNSFDGLSDTMLLARFDPKTQKATILSIPRDTQVELRGKEGVVKINEANRDGGPALAAASVSNLLEGVEVDRYIRVNVQGIEKLIDALGGVEVDVPRDMKYTDHSQHLYIDLKEGKQRLDGDKAVQFLRFRYDQFGDIGRVQRQQMLMRAVVEQTLKPQTLLRMPKILDIIQSNLDTNLTVEEILAIAGFAGQADRSDVQMVMLPGSFSGNGREGISYWLPDEERIKTLMAQHFDLGYATSGWRDPSELRIVIQDTTGNPVAARMALQSLQEAGYRNITLKETNSEPLRMTRVVAQQGDKSSAALVKTALGTGEVLVESTGELYSDVTLQLGLDWLKLLPNVPDAELTLNTFERE